MENIVKSQMVVVEPQSTIESRRQSLCIENAFSMAIAEELKREKV